MSDVELKELARRLKLVLEAPPCGPWKVNADDRDPKLFFVAEMDDADVAHVYDCDGSRTPDEIRAIAEYFALCHPQNIRALLDAALRNSAAA